MKPEDIDKLEAGRELDILIAERIFGWVWVVATAWNARWLCEPDRYQTANPKWPKWDGSTEVLVRYPQQCEPDEHGYLPQYSSDIAAAWEVVEKMKAFSLGQRVDGSWQCWWWQGVHMGAHGETAPLAICRAALKALSAQHSTPEQQCSICGCAFSAAEFEGIICPDCISAQEKLDV
jgi:hypothetical protein